MLATHLMNDTVIPSPKLILQRVNWRKVLAVSLIVLVLATGIAVLLPTQRAEAATVQWNWWGNSIQFSKWETQVIGWGAGAVGVYFGWTGWAAVAAYAAPGLASWATSNGKCLAMNRSWTGNIWFWVYDC